MATEQSSLCPGQEETIYLYLDSALTPAEQTTFESHLQSCLACQKILAETSQLFEDIVDWPALTAPDNLVNEVMAHLPQSAPQTGYQWPLLLLQLLIGLALVVVALPKLIMPYQALLPMWSQAQLTELRLSLSQNMQLPALFSVEALQTQLEQATSLLPMDISLQMALIVIALLLVGWLVGNSLLLKNRSFSMRDGGSV